MKESKKLVLHVGLHKTATSALQIFFHQNREILAHHGCCYPESGLAPIQFEGRFGAHHLLSTQLRQSNPLETARDCFRRTLSAIEEESIELPTCLLSSEFFSEQIHRSELSVLLDKFDRVVLIIYLRRQDELAESQYNQIIKTHKDPQRSIWTIREMLPGRLFFSKILSEWASLFGKENVIARPFETESFYGGNIYSDFLFHGLGIEANGLPFRVSELINKSLGRDTLEYKRLINHLDIGYDLKLATVPHLLRFDKRHHRDSECSPYLLAPSERRKIVESREQDNSQVAREYLRRPNGRLFIRQLPDSNENWTPYRGLTGNSIMSITDFIAREEPELVKVLASGVRVALGSRSERVRGAAESLSAGFVAVFKPGRGLR